MNPNALGLVIITILAAHFAEVIDVIENWVLEHRGPSRLFLFTRIIGMTCLLFLIIMSRSRTAIITFGVLFIVSLFVIVSHGFDKGKINVRRFSGFPALPRLFIDNIAFVFSDTVRSLVRKEHYLEISS